MHWVQLGYLQKFHKEVEDKFCPIPCLKWDQSLRIYNEQYSMSQIGEVNTTRIHVLREYKEHK